MTDATEHRAAKQTEAAFRKAATERIVEIGGEFGGLLATAAYAELKQAWSRGFEAGRYAERQGWKETL